VDPGERGVSIATRMKRKLKERYGIRDRKLSSNAERERTFLKEKEEGRADLSSQEKKLDSLDEKESDRI